MKHTYCVRQIAGAAGPSIIIGMLSDLNITNQNSVHHTNIAFLLQSRSATHIASKKV